MAGPGEERVEVRFYALRSEVKRWKKLADAEGRSFSNWLRNTVEEAAESSALGRQVLAAPAVMDAMVEVFSRPSVVGELAGRISEELGQSPRQLEMFQRNMRDAFEVLKLGGTPSVRRLPGRSGAKRGPVA
jgi:hypothetical protein